MNPSAVVRATICPKNASDKNLIFALVDEAGISSNLAVLETDGIAHGLQRKRTVPFGCVVCLSVDRSMWKLFHN